MKQFFNKKFYSDVVPYEIVEVISPKKIHVREMDAKQLDKPVYDDVHGFINNKDIRYDYSSNDDNRVVTITKRKDGEWYQIGQKSGKYEVRFTNNDNPKKYYDYSF